MLQGDWTVQDNAVIDLAWLRRYDMQGEGLIALNADGEPIHTVDSRQCQRFATVDTAGTSKEKAADAKGKPPSFSVCGVWDYDPRSKYLFLRHVWRAQVGWDGLKAGVRNTIREWHCPLLIIENAHHGRPLASELSSECQTKLVGPKIAGTHGTTGEGAKLERAINSGMLSKLEAGQVFLPKFENSWLHKYEGELLSWTGLPEETADQIDMTSYAAYHVGDRGGSQLVARREADGTITW